MVVVRRPPPPHFSSFFRSPSPANASLLDHPSHYSPDNDYNIGYYYYYYYDYYSDMTCILPHLFPWNDDEGHP